MNATNRKKIQIFLQKHIKSPLRKKRIIKRAYNAYWFFERLFKRKKQERFDLFDYSFVEKGYKYFKCSELYRANSLYGISKSLRDYSSWKKPIKACIEHGVYFGETIMDEETYASGLPGIITFSDFRNNYLRKVTNKPIIHIGPYIAYAEDYFSDYQRIKECLGKVLLVFPSHSGEGITAEFDYQSFIDDICHFKVEHNFQTIIVCLYYNDILLGRHKPYEEKGFKVVTAGRRDDPFFLSRLKSFIKLSDFTASNSVGTHIGYCVFLGKCHYLFNSSEVKYVGNLRSQAGIDDVWYTNKKEVETCFSKYCDVITNEQMDVVEKFWGLRFVRKKEELFDIFEKLDEVFKKSKHKERNYYEQSKIVFGGESDVLK